MKIITATNKNSGTGKISITMNLGVFWPILSELFN